MNDSKQAMLPTMTFREGEDASCPTRGAEVTSWEMNQPVRDKVTMEEAWPGGPVMEVFSKVREQEPWGPAIFTVNPCGHRVGDIVHVHPAESQP